MPLHHEYREPRSDTKPEAPTYIERLEEGIEKREARADAAQARGDNGSAWHIRDTQIIPMRERLDRARAAEDAQD